MVQIEVAKHSCCRRRCTTTSTSRQSGPAINDGAQASAGADHTFPQTAGQSHLTCPRKNSTTKSPKVLRPWGYEEAGITDRRRRPPTRPRRNSHPTRVCSNRQPETRDRSTFTLVSAGDGERSGLDRHVGRCSLGDPFLRKIRLSNRRPRRKAPAAQEILGRARTLD